MKIFKSIKWRLQIWYGLILVVVLAGFGITAYQLERGRVLRRVDDELGMRLHIIADAIHPPRRGPTPGRPPFDHPPGQPPEGGLENELPPLPKGFQLPAWAEHYFGTNDNKDFYYVVSSRGGKEIARGGNAPTRMVSTPYENYFSPVNHLSKINQIKPIPVWTADDFREIFDPLPSGESILVGRSLALEIKELRFTALNLLVIGGVILLIGLFGGWWLVTRAIRPIKDISATAVKISAGDLSQRINTADAESELGQLAGVLNSTFARLESAFAQQKQFASDAAHELRTPVSVMLTQTQTALTRERDAASYKQTVEACQRAAQRMRKLIESLLALARFDAGQEVLKRLRFDFRAAVGECVELVKPLADERGIKISVEGGPLEITGDSERLAQVVTNLLTNAIQYNRPEGEVRVKLESQGGLAVLTVADTGLGIAAEDLPHVFERFYRADASRSSANNGLGLAISKAIIEAHGGTIKVASVQDDGTIFTVRLPV